MRTDGGNLAQLVHDEAADRVVGAVLGQANVGAARQLVGAQRAGNEERPVGSRADTEAALVVLVRDFANDLFDDVFEGDDAGNTAVFVDDDGHLQALVAQLDHQRADRHGLGNGGRVGHEGGRDDGNLGAAFDGHGDRAAQGDQAEDVVGVVADHREAGVAGLAGQVEDVLGAVALAEGVQTPAVGHDVGGAERGHADRVDEQVGRRHVEGAFFDGVLNEGGQLGSRARRRDFLLRLNAHAGKYPVRGAAEHPDDGAGDGGEGHLEGHDAHGRGHRVGQRQVLGHKFTKEHREHIDERGGREGGDAGRQAPREPGGTEPAFQQLGQGGLGRVAQQDRRQGNADLGARELGRQSARRSQHRSGAAVSFLGVLVKDGLIDRNKGELGGDEHEGPGGQDDAKQEHESGRQRCPLSTRPGRAGRIRAGRGRERAAGEPAESQSMMHPV